MTATQPQPPSHPAGPRVLYYAENHCALRWPLLFSGLYAPILALGLLTAMVVVHHGALSWVLLALGGLAFLSWTPVVGMLMPYVWPAGIRLDSDGVYIGGLRWAERHPGRARPRRKRRIAWQCAQVFSCPWDGVLHIGISRRRDRLLKVMRYARYRHEPTLLGNLAAPCTRAALVIWIDTDRARLPAVRPADSLHLKDSPDPRRGEPIWIVPTRHPEALQAALATIPVPPGTLTDPLGDAFGELSRDFA